MKTSNFLGRTWLSVIVLALLVCTTPRTAGLDSAVPPRPTFFPAAEYLNNYPDLKAAFAKRADAAEAAWAHFWTTGLREGRSDGTVKAADYLAANPDVRTAFGNDAQMAALHWYTYGRAEGRMLPAAFNADTYLARYADLRGAFKKDKYAAYQHYITTGANEGRTFDDDFVPLEYLALYPDLASAFKNDRGAATLHWLRYGSAEKRLGRIPVTFAAGNYLANYSDLRNAFGSDGTQVNTAAKAFWHYVNNGSKEGRTMSAYFSPTYYLANNPDLQTAFKGDSSAAARHWFNFGYKEGRFGSAEAKRLGINPPVITHYTTAAPAVGEPGSSNFGGVTVVAPTPPVVAPTPPVVSPYPPFYLPVVPVVDPGSIRSPSA